MNSQGPWEEKRLFVGESVSSEKTLSVVQDGNSVMRMFEGKRGIFFFSFFFETKELSSDQCEDFTAKEVKVLNFAEFVDTLRPVHFPNSETIEGQKEGNLFL